MIVSTDQKIELRRVGRRRLRHWPYVQHVVSSSLAFFKRKKFNQFFYQEEQDAYEVEAEIRNLQLKSEPFGYQEL